MNVASCDHPDAPDAKAKSRQRKAPWAKRAIERAKAVARQEVERVTQKRLKRLIGGRSRRRYSSPYGAARAGGRKYRGRPHVFQFVEVFSNLPVTLGRLKRQAK